jgi:hypothetical protein
LFRWLPASRSAGEPELGTTVRKWQLVDHLAYSVFQQNHELVERSDLALQLDAVPQPNK